VPTLVASDMFPEVLSAFLVLAMVAAAMSSLDSVLLVAASTLERDVVALLYPKLSEAINLNLTRIFVVALAIFAGVIALKPPAGVVTLTIFSGSVYAACFFPALIFGLHWRRGNGLAAVSSILTGIVVLAIWVATDLDNVVHEVFPALFASMLVFVVLAWLTAPNEDPRIQQAFAED